MAQTNLILTKESTQSEIKNYFSSILELSKSDNEFSINLDEVWMLVYTEKGKAVRALKENFIEGVDYRTFAQNGKTDTGGYRVIEYHLTVSCLEFFLNNRYREDGELIKFVQERRKTLGESSMPFVIIWGDFPTDQYGKVELIWNNKVIGSAKLTRDKHNLIYWNFYE